MRSVFEDTADPSVVSFRYSSLAPDRTPRGIADGANMEKHKA